jgi:hypothetical protein
MRRRAFIAGLRDAAAWPLVVGGHQAGTQVIGYLGSGAPIIDLILPRSEGTKSKEKML